MYNPYNWTIRSSNETDVEKWVREYNDLVNKRQALQDLIFHLEEEIKVYKKELKIINNCIIEKDKDAERRNLLEISDLSK